MTARRDSIGLTIASVVNGVAAYAVVVVAGRSLDDAAFADFSVAWSLWALSVALLVFPAQHWIIWRNSQDGDTSAVRSALPRVLVLIGVVLFVLWLAGTSRLFPSGEFWGPILALIGATSAVLGLGRGSLAAQGRYDSVAWVIGLENVLRLLGLVVALGVLAGSARSAVLSIGVGIGAIAPFATRLRFTKGNQNVRVRVLAELGALAGATALAQVMVQFPPALADWLGEPATRVSAIFATFSLGRAPLLVVLAVSTRLTDPLARILRGPSDVVRPLLAKSLAGATGLFFASAVFGYVLGPEVVGWFFGVDKTLSELETAYVAGGLALAVVGVLATLGLMVHNANRLAASVWLLALTVALATSFLGLGIPEAFVISEALAAIVCAGFVWALSSARQRPLSSR